MNWKWSMNIISVLWWRLQQCLGIFNMLLVERWSEKRHFRHLSDYIFGVCNFGNTKSMRAISVPESLKFKLDFKNVAETWENFFWFWDNCIWIGYVKLSLLRTGFFSSARNMLRRSPKTWMSIRETFSNSIDLALINEYDKGAVMHIWTVLGHVYHVSFRRVLWNETF